MEDTINDKSFVVSVALKWFSWDSDCVLLGGKKGSPIKQHLTLKGRKNDGKPVQRHPASSAVSQPPLQQEVSSMVAWIIRFSFIPNLFGEARMEDFTPPLLMQWVQVVWKLKPMNVGVSYTFGCKDLTPSQETVSYGSWVNPVWA